MVRSVRKTITFAVVFAGLLSFAAVTPALARASAKGRFFTGFWEGIDPADGSTVQMSLSNTNHDGSLDFIYREGFFTYCYNNDSKDTQGRGFEEGTATVVSKDKITVDATCICVNDDNTQNSESCSFEVSADRRSGVLIIPNFSYPQIIMHRTSCK